ncbi:MAG: DUF2075 domain-containing protein [Chitinophagales bacterium]|nr:DUF2075 domain-containing protein [Chitinophagales bacterium]
MAREKWLINPGELDEFQRKIRELSIDDSYVIKGCAGSGKTVLALYRANDIRIKALAEDKPADFTMLVYTKVLREFIKSGILDLGLKLNQIVVEEGWDGDEVDYIVVDEAQDFSTEKINAFSAAKRKSIMLYGDTQQQLYSGSLSTEEIAKLLDVEQKELKLNYRLPKTIASFASHVISDSTFETKCVKVGVDKPRLMQFATWQKELDFIAGEIQTRNYTDVGILLPFNTSNSAPRRNGHRNVDSVQRYFESIGIRVECKIRDERDRMDLDFDSDLPKVMPYHSSKGLQFETVFIPFCDVPCDSPIHRDWYLPRYRRPFYVALTRSYRNLYLTYSSTLSPFINDIPKSKYD